MQFIPTLSDGGFLQMADKKNRMAEEKVLGVWTDEEFKDVVVRTVAVSVMVGAMSFVLSWLGKRQLSKRQEERAVY